MELESAHQIWSRRQTGAKREPRPHDTTEKLFEHEYFTPKQGTITIMNHFPFIFYRNQK